MEEIEEVELQAICQRKHHSTRARVDQLVAEGWEIIGREPLILQRGRAKLEVRKNGIIVSA